MPSITINGKKIEAPENMTILEVARENGIFIPTLCHNDSLMPYGGCRLCVVEVIKNGKTTIETSCTYPAEPGLTVKTDTARIKRARKVIIGLLLNRSPKPVVIQDIAAEYGITEPQTRFMVENEHCIRCGLCVRACREIVRARAISFSGMGYERKVTTPFNEASSDCIGCGTCELICPTKVIDMKDLPEAEEITPSDHEKIGPTRNLYTWNTEFKVKVCKECGNPFYPAQPLQKFQEAQNLKPEFFDTCPSCRIPPKVDEELCLGCGGCVVNCPIGAIMMKEKDEEQRSNIYRENCTGCHYCVDKCVVGAIKLEE
jgi:NADH dehydrogenase/NADH:ubiquinone oxidoreductase subunit G